MKLSIAQLQETLLAYKRADFSENKAAIDIGMSRGTFQNRLQQAKRWMRTADGKAFGKLHGFGKHKVGPEVLVRQLQGEIKQWERKFSEIAENNLRTEQVREYIFGLAKTQPKPAEWVNDREVFKYRHGIPALFLSDEHYGETVHQNQVFGCNEFNSRICIERVHRVVDTTIHLLSDVLHEPNFPGIALILGGDNINGALRESALAGNDRLVYQQAIEVADLLHDVILKLLNEYKRVFIPGVPGNHGRGTVKPWADFYAETNLDWLVYQMLERFLKAEVEAGRVSFLTPPARDVTFKIAGRRFRLTHGDQFRGGDSIIGPLGPVTRGDNKKRTMAMTLPTSSEEYDTLLVAHFHRLYHHDNLIMNGSIVGFNPYSLAQNFSFEYPKQSLFLTHEKYGINHMMPVLAVKPNMDRKGAPWVEVMK